MSITTLDGVIAGMQYPRDIVKAATPLLVVGRPHSLFYLAGAPGAATQSVAGSSGESLTTYAGQISFTNPATTDIYSYLARFQGQATQAGMLCICDRLWHNSGLLATSGAQTVNSVPWPARDANGSTSGEGVLIGMEFFTTGGTGVPTLSMVYTNSAGTTGQVGAGILTVVAASQKGAFYQMGLAAGDSGVQAVKTFTVSTTMTTGAYSLVAYRTLANVDLTLAGVSNSVDAITGGFPRLYNNTVPFLVFTPSAVTASVISAQVIYSQG